MSNITIAVDAMGGDNAPFEIVKGCVSASNEHKNIKIILVGRQNDVQAELDKYVYDKSKIESVNADQVIATDEVPTAAIKNTENERKVTPFTVNNPPNNAIFLTPIFQTI